MNCKKGDLAIIIGDTWGYDERLPELRLTAHSAGRVVECVELVDLDGEPAWFIGEPITLKVSSPRGIGTVEMDVITDSLLRPLRDGEGEDETLAWAGRPEVVPA